MKAFLLAAGNGTRLRPLTEWTPKCLLPVSGKPILGIWLELCLRHGIKEVLINLHAHPQAIREYVARKHQNIHVKFFEEPTLLGSAGTIAANRGWVSGEAFFWILYVDVLTNMNLREPLNFHLRRPQVATLVANRVPNPSLCGILTRDENGIVGDFIEKPANPTGNLAFAGILIGTQGLIDAIPDYRPADMGFDVLPRLAGRMAAYETSEYLLDIGSVQNYKQAQTTWPGLC